MILKRIKRWWNREAPKTYGENPPEPVGERPEPPPPPPPPWGRGYQPRTEDGQEDIRAEDLTPPREGMAIEPPPMPGGPPPPMPRRCDNCGRPGKSYVAFFMEAGTKDTPRPAPLDLRISGCLCSPHAAVARDKIRKSFQSFN